MFPPSVSAHVALNEEERKLLAEHLAAPREGDAAWPLASTAELRGLYAWAETLAMFGRETAFRAADAAIAILEDAWAVGADEDPANEVIAAIKDGHIPPPAAQIAAARAWLAAPSEDAAIAADATIRDAPPGLDGEDFAYMRDRPFVWMLIAAQGLVAVTNHPDPGQFVGQAAVCAAAATGAAVPVGDRIATAVNNWRSG